jgi:rubrerythrin
VDIRGKSLRRPWMTLSTFGAIMGFAAQMVQQTETLYKTMIQKVENPVLREALQLLLEEEGKNYSLMERTRRENVTEMILEPIAGLHPDDYEIKTEGMDQSRDVDLLKTALVLEERERRFFSEVSDKVPLPEVGRVFRKVAQKKEKSLAKLKSLGLTQL